MPHVPFRGWNSGHETRDGIRSLMTQCLGRRFLGDITGCFQDLFGKALDHSAPSFGIVTSCFFHRTFVTGVLAFATTRARFASWSSTSCCSALLSAVAAVVKPSHPCIDSKSQLSVAHCCHHVVCSCREERSLLNATIFI